MELIHQYFTDILAAILTLTLIIIMAIIKRSSIKKEVIEEEIEPQEKDDKTIEEEMIIEDTIVPVIHEDEPEEEAAQADEKEVNKSETRLKRELVAHGKINKDNFKEFAGTRILIAEDNFINQKVITGLLADTGIEIVMANDGQECLNILKDDTNFALILMDAHMPVIDGFQATRQIRKTPEYEHIPVIALSGDTAADDIKNMLNVGMEAHLEKPLKMDALYDILYMYTTGDEQEGNNTKEEDIEFDIEQGLEICGGDKEFYLEILNEFMDNYSNSDKQIKEYLSQNDSKSADQILLDISGLAANIGAEHLHTAALKLKEDIKSPEDMAYIDSLKNYTRSLKHISELITEYKKTN
jgi:CheY-like chemotaxis protein